MSNLPKRSHVEVLIEKMETALNNDFYFEAVWLAYSLIEDRVDSALRKTTGGLTSSRALFGKKLDSLIQRIPNDSTLTLMKTAYNYDLLLQKINVWKDSRNNLMHALANSVKPRVDLETECQLIAREGYSLAREMLTRGYDLKNLLQR